MTRCERVPVPAGLTGPAASTPPAPAPPASPTPTPTVSYQAHVDPSFTQAAKDPLAVTYAYSASATSQTGSAPPVNLGATGQLPVGILDFYGQATSSGPESLYCSMNVGAAVLGGSCPISYTQPGAYKVTTQYIPDAASAVTETDSETVSPFATTTTLTAASEPCSANMLYGPDGLYGLIGPGPGLQFACWRLSATAVDQNGSPPGLLPCIFAPGPVTCYRGGAILLSTQQPNLWAGAIDPGTVCDVAVYRETYQGQAQQAGGYSPDCRTNLADVQWTGSVPFPASWTLTASFQSADSPGGAWATSPPSAPVTLTP